MANYIDYYEKCFKTLKEAQECKALTGGTISTFLSIGEHEQPITIYCVRYKQLF